MSLLKMISEQQHAFHNDDRPQIDKARKEAEALFRPKMRIVEPSLVQPAPVEALARKPRVLSASAPSLGLSRGNDRERLNRARAAIFKQQHELRAKLELIDSEIRAIDAYKAVVNSKTGRKSVRTNR